MMRARRHDDLPLDLRNAVPRKRRGRNAALSLELVGSLAIEHFVGIGHIRPKLPVAHKDSVRQAVRINLCAVKSADEILRRRGLRHRAMVGSMPGRVLFRMALLATGG